MYESLKINLITQSSQKCFHGAGYMKVGGTLGSQGTLSSVFRVCAYSKVSAWVFFPGKNIHISMLKDAMTGHLTGCSGADPPNLLTSASSAHSELFSV